MARFTKLQPETQPDTLADFVQRRRVAGVPEDIIAEDVRQLQAIQVADEEKPTTILPPPVIPPKRRFTRIEESGQALGLPATTFGAQQPRSEEPTETPFWEPIFNILNAPGEYARGLTAGKPGERVSSSDISGATEAGEYTFQETGSPTLAALVESGRELGGTLIDPLAVVGTTIGKRLLDVFRRAPSIPPVELPIAPQGAKPTFEVPRTVEVTPREVGSYSEAELLTPPSSRIPGTEFYTGSGELQVPGQQFIEPPYEPLRLPTFDLPAAAEPLREKGVGITIRPPFRVPTPEELYPQYYQPIKQAAGHAQHDPRVMAAADDLPLRAKEKLPRGFNSIFMDAIEKLRNIHPAGAKAADLWLDYRQTMEQNAINGWRSIAAMKETGQFTPTAGMASWERAMDRIWGARSMFSPLQFHPFQHYSTQGLWKISKHDTNQMIDYLYSNGRILPTGPNKDRIIASADAFSEATMEASSHPGVRELQMWDSVGMKWKPLGQPGPFFPHLPLSTAAQRLHGRAYEEAFERYREKFPHGSRSEFNDFIKRHTGSEDVQGYVGIQLSRLFDAERLGRPSKVLAKHGYSTDPRQALFNYLNGAYGAGERKLRQAAWSELENEISIDITDSGVRQRISTLFQRMRGSDSELPDRTVGGVISAINNASNAGLLQLSTPAQTNQIVYAIERGGLVNTAKAIGSTLFRREPAFDTATAASYADLLATLLPTRGLQIGGRDIQFAKLLQAELFVNGFTATDDILRGVAAKTGDNYLKSLHYGLKRKPSNEGIRAQLAELGVDADRLLRDGLTPRDRLTAAKRFADETQGRRDMRGLPLWATENTTTKRLLLNLKNFMLINMANLRRDVVEAYKKGVPLKTVAARTVRGLAAADVTGEVTKDILYTLVNMEEPGGKRVPHYARELFGDEGGVTDFSRHVDNVLAGFSAIALSALITVAQRDELKFFEFIAPPPVALAGRILQDLGSKEHKGKTLSRLIHPTVQRALYPPKERVSTTLPSPFRLEP